MAKILKRSSFGFFAEFVSSRFKDITKLLVAHRQCVFKISELLKVA